MLDLMRGIPVMPSLTIRDPAHAVPLAHALVRGGLPLIEIMMQGADPLGCLTRIAAEVPGAIAGAGAIASRKELRRATRAGARFATTPGFLPRLSDDADIPLLPGVATASEIMAAIEHGHDLLSLFPTGPVAALPLLRAFHARLPRARFCPTGAIPQPLAARLLAEPNVACVTATWLDPPHVVDAGNWEHIELLAHDAASLRSPPALAPALA